MQEILPFKHPYGCTVRAWSCPVTAPSWPITAAICFITAFIVLKLLALNSEPFLLTATTIRRSVSRASQATRESSHLDRAFVETAVQVTNASLCNTCEMHTWKNNRCSATTKIQVQRTTWGLK